MTANQHELLVKKIKKKDMQAIITWIDAKKTKLYRIGWAYLRNHHDVEDVFQNTILKIYDKIYQLREPKYFESWVISIFINECNSLYRKRKWKQVNQSEPMDDMHIQDLRIDIIEALSQLEGKYKEVVILKYFSDYSQEKVAEVLKLPIGTVKSRIHRGLRLLKAEMERGV